MIDLPELIAPERVFCRCEVKSKKRAIQTVAELMALSINDEELSEMDIMDALVGREKIGSTAIGHGVALPHANPGSRPRNGYADHARKRRRF